MLQALCHCTLGFREMNFNDISLKISVDYGLLACDAV
jgi:hypothetical protein